MAVGNEESVLSCSLPTIFTWSQLLCGVYALNNHEEESYEEARPD